MLVTIVSYFYLTIVKPHTYCAVTFHDSVLIGILGLEESMYRNASILRLERILEFLKCLISLFSCNLFTDSVYPTLKIYKTLLKLYNTFSLCFPKIAVT